ncbi:hypothetical protein ACLMJK_000701 [Lecanora helva]
MASVASLLSSDQVDRKRSHSQITNEHGHSFCNTHHHDPPNHNARTSPGGLFNLNIPPFRRGFDLRRPVMSSLGRDVIDLTGETSSPPEPYAAAPPQPINIPSTAANRPPRFDRNIINVDEVEHDAVDLREESPEIQFLTSRPRSRSLSATRPVARRRPGMSPAARSPGPRVQVPVRVTAEDRNPNQVAGFANALHNLQFPRPYHSNFVRAHGNNWVGIEGDFTIGNGGFQVPDNLDFLQAGFDYERPSRPQQQPRSPTYQAPPAARNGFTRSPKEEDILVCPHCSDELGVGENDVKKQVWVVKACGHINQTELASVLTKASKAMVEVRG